MKNISLIIFLISLTSALQGQTSGFFEEIALAKFTKLEAKIDDKIDFCIKNDNKYITKEKALKRLRNFFNKTKVISAKKVHEGGNIKKGNHYIVGKIKTAENNYRMYIYFRMHKIIEIRLE